MRSILSNDPEIKATLKRLNLLPQGKKPLDAPFSELAKLINERTVVKRKGKVPRWNGLTELDVIDEAWEEGIGALAALPVAWLLARARVAKGEENKEILSGFLSLQGWARIGLEQVILPSLDDMLRRKITIREAMEELAMRTVDQHTRIAWSRLAADPNRDVVLLTDDGGFWTRKKKKKEFAAGQTASRLIQAIGWLRQLGLIDENGCTEHGKRYLEQIRSTLNTQGGEE